MGLKFESFLPPPHSKIETHLNQKKKEKEGSGGMAVLITVEGELRRLGSVSIQQYANLIDAEEDDTTIYPLSTGQKMLVGSIEWRNKPVNSLASTIVHELGNLGAFQKIHGSVVVLEEGEEWND